MGIYIIAEAGVNHNGNPEFAQRLCDAAFRCGADAVKFQTFKTERILTRYADMASYQVSNTEKKTSQFEMVKALELSQRDFVSLKRYCDSIGIEFLSTPDDEESLSFLVEELGIRRIKVGSGEVTNIPFLREIGRTEKPVILSTGMATLGETEKAIDELELAGAPEISLLHCTTNYPCPFNEVNLKAMITLRQAFGRGVGYSDHTLGLEIPVAAAALGAVILEKHLTLDKSMPGPDHAASSDPGEFRAMVQAVRNVEKSLGDGIKRPNPSELLISKSVRRSIVASRHISRGEILGPDNLAVKRAGGAGIRAEFWDLIVGKTAARDFAEDDCVEFDS